MAIGGARSAVAICHNDSVRRLLAISLLTLFALPFALPLCARDAADANLPICCRRDGKHHCAAMDMGSSDGTSLRTVGEKCPYSIAPPAILVLPSLQPSNGAAIFAGIVRHPAVAPQIEAQQRISFDRTRQKRGPPNQSL
jgi:hypothetical protein